MKTKDLRRLFIAKVKKNFFSNDTIHAVLKYDFNQEQRDYILEKLSPKYKNIAYCNPLPDAYEDLCKLECFHSDESNLEIELQWYFDNITLYKQELGDFFEYMDNLESAILKDTYENALEILDLMDEHLGTSFFTLESEFYINEIKGNGDQNQLILNDLAKLKTNHKPLLIAEFSKLRTGSKTSSYFYNATIEQHKTLYDEDSRQYLDYIIFKLDPMNYDTDLKNLAFIAAFDSDFAIIDRYHSLKKIIVFLLSFPAENNGRNQALNFANTNWKLYPDSFWLHLSLLSGNSKFSLTSRTSAYYKLTDLFFVGDFELLIEECALLLDEHPNYSENYVIFVQSLLLLNRSISDYLSTDTELHQILSLISSVLEKNEHYSSDREKLLKKYYSISHFNFSNAILEFIVNEYHLNNPIFIQYFSFLQAQPIRYNFYKIVTNKANQLAVVSALSGFKTFNYIEKLIKGQEVPISGPNFFQMKLKVGYLMSMEQYQSANNEISNYSNNFKPANAPAFIDTWIAKNAVKCFIKLKEFSKAADLIVDSFFESDNAFDHFYDSELFTALSESDEAIEQTNISVPILFQIYSQPNSVIYDAIANFLIKYDLYKPTEILKNAKSFDSERFNFLLEKCFIKENIEDSPFLNSIEELEGERIEILNYLKEIDDDNQERYNEEILKITREASIRKGLMQIHESRIYVDTSSLSKSLKIQQREIFDRYLDFNSVSDGQAYARKLGDEVTVADIIYYFRHPIDATILPVYEMLYDYRLDPNVVVVPFIKYKFFQSLFEDIKKAFVFDEDYGFKSFLSMRIRHGTFSNVLRTVFDKFHLIASKDSLLQNYGEIEFWNQTFQDKQKNKRLQNCLAVFSEKIDSLIDEGLSWVKVRSHENGMITGMFDFSFSASEMFNIYRNRIGRLIDFQAFIDEVFDTLYEKLEKNLEWLRDNITAVLTPRLLELLTLLQKEIEAISFDESGNHLLLKHIVDCSTEVQVVTSQMTNWFKISKNQYIEEFPIDLSLQAIIDYMNSINQNALHKAELKIKNTFEERIKGKYFESFGDIFINLFDNAIYKNRDLDEKLRIHIAIFERDGLLKINFKNNISKQKDLKELERKIAEAKIKIKNYQNGSTVSFEKGSGYLKLCKSIAVDLGRRDYNIEPRYENFEFEVEISFDLNTLYHDRITN